MKQPRDTAAASMVGASSTEPAPAEVPAMPPATTDVRHVVVTTKAMQQVVDIEVEAAWETEGFKSALLDRGPKMMIGSVNSEMQ